MEVFFIFSFIFIFLLTTQGPKGIIAIGMRSLIRFECLCALLFLLLVCVRSLRRRSLPPEKGMIVPDVALFPCYFRQDRMFVLKVNHDLKEAGPLYISRVI